MAAAGRFPDFVQHRTFSEPRRWSTDMPVPASAHLKLAPQHHSCLLPVYVSGSWRPCPAMTEPDVWSSQAWEGEFWKLQNPFHWWEESSFLGAGGGAGKNRSFAGEHSPTFAYGLQSSFLICMRDYATMGANTGLHLLDVCHDPCQRCLSRLLCKPT